MPQPADMSCHDESPDKPKARIGRTSPTILSNKAVRRVLPRREQDAKKIRIGALWWLSIATCAAPCGGASTALASDPSGDPGASDLTSLSIDQLMNLEVTSVSKRPERFGDTAAALTVITQDDIRRSGLTSVPELLRLVPGLEVAQSNSNSWAITARGFNNNFANKLLVLIDGRSIYSPAFSGTYWDIQDLILEDIERIEVIRGPAGALYGANAVNGVINIITKSAKDTQGALLTATTGNLQPGAVGGRYGGKFGENGYFRIYAKGLRNSSFEDASGAPGQDSWSQLRGGFRLDWAPRAGDSLTAMGDYYDSTFDERVTFGALTPTGVATVDTTQRALGGYGLLRWQHDLSATSNATLQVYYDRADRDLRSIYGLSIDTYDFDFQHRFRWGDRHDIVWGAGFRDVDATLINGIPVRFSSNHAIERTFSLFVQDQVALRENLHLTLGSKFEHNNFTGFEYQPSLALAWEPVPGHTLWASLSRVVRTPSLGERSVTSDVAAQPNPVPGAPPILIQATGNPTVKSERALSWELGYRSALSRALSIDLTGFYTRYTQLQDFEIGTLIPASTLPAHIILPLQTANLNRGRAFGIEASATWQVTRNWRLSASYTWLEVDVQANSSGAVPSFSAAGSTPQHQAQLHSYLALPWSLEFDTSLYYVGHLPSGGANAYNRLDLRLGWRPSPTFEISIAGQNLLQPRHFEFSTGSVLISPTEIPRSVVLRVAARF